MFNKLYKTLEDIQEYIHKQAREFHEARINISADVSTIKSYMSYVPEKLEKTVESQQRTIELLTNALKDKYKHGLFVVSENGRIPMVIRNGQELTSKLTSYCSVEWSLDEIPRITTEQNGITHYDMEV